MRAAPTRCPTLSLVACCCVLALSPACRVIREPEPTPGKVTVRIENASGSEADVAITIDAPTTASALDAADLLTADGTVRVGAGSYSEGAMLCGQQFVVSATVGQGTATVVFEGAGTGTPGFDEGSVGLDGERTLMLDTHYQCDDSIVVRITDDGTRTAGDTDPVGAGEITVYQADQAVPDPDLPSSDTAGPDQGQDAGAEPSDTGVSADDIQVRVENGTHTDAQVTLAINEFSQQTGLVALGESSGSGEDNLTDTALIRVTGAQYTEGTLACGQQVTISATVGDPAASVLFSGDGTGTPGFDEGSAGVDGERSLLYGDHFTCGGTLVVRISDDGTGVGLSKSETPLGNVTAFSAGETPPEPVLPADDALEEQVDIAVYNQTGSGIEMEFVVGTGDSSSDEQINVNVLPAGIADGSLACARQITVRALIVSSDSGVDGAEPTLYQVTLTGDGTGTPGFDEDTIGPGNSRIFFHGEHFECGDVIEVTILDDAAGIDEAEDGVARIGAGTVQVLHGVTVQRAEAAPAARPPS